MSEPTINLHTKAWYRVLQLFRVLAYLVGIGLVYALSLGAASYSYEDFSTGQVIQIPARPFNWELFVIGSLVTVVLVEVLHSGVVYLVAGKSFMQDLYEKLKRLDRWVS